MIYLASSSPRRRVLLRQAGVRFRIVRPRYEEKNDRHGMPQKLVVRHALGKARSASVESGIVIGADTLVYFRGKVIGKPKSLREAQRILSRLQGCWHSVWTGAAIVEFKNGRIVRQTTLTERTGVRIRRMTPPQIRSYLRRIHPLDKAGAYAIQSKRAGIVEDVKGSFSNAVGLPMERLGRYFKR